MRSRRFAAVAEAGTGAESVASLHAKEERFVDEMVDAIRADVVALAHTPPDAVEHLVRTDLRNAIAAVAGDRGPSDEERARSAKIAAGFARAGVPIEIVLDARRAGIRRASELVGELGGALGFGPDEEVECIYRLWQWADAVQVSDAEAHRTAELEMRGGGEEERAWVVRSLLEGTLARAEIATKIAPYGLAPGAMYHAIRARPARGGDGPALAKEISATGSRDGLGVLLGTLDGDICGVVSRPPRVSGEGVVGVGDAAGLSGLDWSFQLATRALETAVGFGYQGVTTIDDLSLRPAIVSESHLGERLVRRYLDPLRELGDFGATLEETVHAYLANGLRVDESAEALYVHPNTLRHRLDRFQQVTGADLRRTQDLLEVWWALERRRLGAADQNGSGD